MKPDPDYYGPVWIIDGEHKGKLGFVDDYDEDDDGQECGIVYLEGEDPIDGDYELVLVGQLDVPPAIELDGLEDRIWKSAGRAGRPNLS